MTFPSVEKAVIRFKVIDFYFLSPCNFAKSILNNSKDIVIVLGNADVSSDFTETFAKVVFHYRVANMEDVTFLSNVFATRDGMVFFAVNVSIFDESEEQDH